MVASSGQKRILIFSASFGGGHTAMARALKEYLRSHHGEQVEVDVVDMLEEFAPSLNVLAKFAYQQPDGFFPGHHGTFKDLTSRLPGNPAVAEAGTTLLPAVEAYLQKTSPDAVVSLHTFLGGVATEAAGQNRLCSTVVSTFDARAQWLHPDTTLYFCAGRTVREQLTVEGIAWDRIVESGIPVREQFAEDVEKENARRELGLAEKFTVLLRADQGKPDEVVDVATRMLRGGIQVAALTSGNDRMSSRLLKESVAGTPLVVLDRVEGVHVLMAASDVLVSRPGGLMLPEACASGLPIVLSPPMPGQEGANVDFLVNYGAALMARDFADVVDKVRFLAMHERRMEQMSESARLVGKGGAAQTICERILAAIR